MSDETPTRDLHNVELGHELSGTVLSSFADTSGSEVTDCDFGYVSFSNVLFTSDFGYFAKGDVIGWLNFNHEKSLLEEVNPETGEILRVQKFTLIPVIEGLLSCGHEAYKGGQHCAVMVCPNCESKFAGLP